MVRYRRPRACSLDSLPGRGGARSTGGHLTCPCAASLLSPSEYSRVNLARSLSARARARATDCGDERVRTRGGEK